MSRWGSGSARLRLRRRLLVFSAPVALLLVVVIVKSVSVVIAGESAVSAFTERDNAGLRRAVDSLTVLNVIEPAKAYFAAGSLAVLDNRLEEADRQFSESLSRTEVGESCSVRVNLELVRETLGDRAAAVLDSRTAAAYFIGARTVVQEAPQGCFAGNTDPDPQRQAVLNEALPRLNQKIGAAQTAPPPPPPPTPLVTPPPPMTSGGAPAEDGSQLRLEPGTPTERLQQILRDAAERDRG
ncbi:hypothetical protein [Mycolicibacterium gadium]|uniref:Uncharacterized protein n=1 Tax=Mycolicibacterium gadium TaxID=1794 RepID=A0ABT6GYG8_MYCGU|nr:hypothetical protein [Mycolicibacterium gadium]MDG5486110.1 hypothetical protein [Mycolicibacterium gadium]